MSEKKSLGGLLSFFKGNKNDINKNNIDQLYTQALEEFKNKNLDLSESLFRQVLEINEHYSDAIINLAKIVYHKQNYVESIDLFKKYLSEKPNSFDAKIRLCRAYISNNDFDSAIGILNQLNNLETDLKKKNKIINTLALAYYSQGNFLKKKENFKEAIISYEYAKKFEDNEPKSIFYISECYISWGKDSKAIDLFNSVITNEKYLDLDDKKEEFSKYSEFLFDICFSYISLESKNNNLGKVVNICQSALKLNINESYKYYFKAKINIIHKKFDSAILELKEFIKNEKYLYESYNELYNLFLATNDLNSQLEALDNLYKSTLNEVEKNEITLKIAVLQVKLGQYNNAHQNFILIQDSMKSDTQLIKYMGKAMLEVGEFELAFKNLTLAKVLLKNDLDIPIWILQYYKKVSKFEIYLKEIDLLLEKNPTNKDLIVEKLDYYLITDKYEEGLDICLDFYQKYSDNKFLSKYLAIFYNKNKKVSDSIKYYEIYLESFKDDYDSIFNLANIYFDNVYIDKSIKLFETLVENSSKYYLDSQSHLVNIYISKGNFEKALGLLDKTIKMYPEYIDSYIKLGKINIHLGKKDKAISYLNYALSIDPNNQDALHLRDSAKS